MGLRDKVISEENNNSFLVSDSERYKDPEDIVRFQVHDSIRDQYVITQHFLGALGSVKILDILIYPEEAVEFAYRKAKKYAQKDSHLGIKCEDRTSFKDKI